MAHISQVKKQRSRKRKSGEDNLGKEMVILAFTLAKELGVKIAVFQMMFPEHSWIYKQLKKCHSF